MSESSNGREYSGPIFKINEGQKKSHSRAFDYDLSLLLGEYERNIRIASREILGDPKDIESYFFRSLSYYEIGDYENADLDIGIVLNLTKAIIPDIYISQGKAYELGKRYKWAICCYEIANRVQRTVKNLFYLGNIYNLNSDWTKAISLFTETIEIEPQNFRGYRGRSEALWASGEKQDAINDLKICLDLNPNLAGVYANLAEYLFQVNNFNEEAICLLRLSLELEPSNAKYFFALGNYYSSWNAINGISVEFIVQYKIPEHYSWYYDSQAFEERLNIAKGFYSQAFVGLFESFRTDMEKLNDKVKVSIFVGGNYLFDPLQTNTLFFTNAAIFPDKIDCPLLNPLNQHKLAVNISYDNIRVRCCSSICDFEGISKSFSMWDRYADGHKGVCYTLSIPKNWLIKNGIYASKIKYADDSSSLEMITPEQVIQDGLFTKHTGYQHENEFRLVALGKFSYPNGQKFNFYGGSEDDSIRIERIYAGAYMSETNKQQLTKLLSNYAYKINTFQMLLAKNNQLTCESL